MAFTMETIKRFLPLLEAEINNYLNTYGWCVNNKLKLVRLYVEPYNGVYPLGAICTIVSEVDISNLGPYDSPRYWGHSEGGVYTEKVHVYGNGVTWYFNPNFECHISTGYMTQFTRKEGLRESIRAFESCRALTNRIKEELVAAVWHPRRVAKLLEEGGWETVEMIAR